MNKLKKPTLPESMKILQEMTLLDKFLFNEAMSDTETHEAVLQIILGEDTLRLLTPAQTEKELQTAPWLRAIRLDVYALDEAGTVYDTEMQAQERNNLRKRSRYYQSLIDSSLLSPGTINFNELKDVCVIMITPFDLFGEGRYVYTFIPCCRENRELELEDGAVRIFLNTRGTNDDEVTPELKAFLRYVESTDGTFAENSGSKRLKKIHACVDRIKASEKVGVKYMQRWEEREWDRAEARAEARAEGLAEGRAEGLAEGRAEGRAEGLAEGRAEGQHAALDLMRKLMQEKNMTAEEALIFLEKSR